MTLLAPGADLIVVKNTAGDTMTGPILGVVEHVQAGNGLDAVLGVFNDPAREASATWWIGKNGQLVQFTPDARTRMWAQGTGNSQYQSVETEGFPTEALTAAQITTFGKLYAWGHTELGWAFQIANEPGQKGLGIHSMGGAAWGGHPCPGPIRAGQRAAILAAAQAPPKPVPLPPPGEGAWAARDGDWPPGWLIQLPGQPVYLTSWSGGPGIVHVQHVSKTGLARLKAAGYPAHTLLATAANKAHLQNLIATRLIPGDIN